MTPASMLVSFGLVLTILFAYMLRRSGYANKVQSSELPAVQNIPSPATDRQVSQLLERVFGENDWNYLKRRAPRDAQRLFVQKRRQLAFDWLTLVKANANAAMHHYLTNARMAKSIEPVLEFKIAANYLAFQLNCAVVFAIVWLRGPVSLRRAVAPANDLCQRLQELAAISFSGPRPKSAMLGNS